MDALASCFGFIALLWIGIVGYAIIFSNRLTKLETKFNIFQNKLDAIMKILIEIKNR